MSYAGDDVSYSSPKATRDALSHLLAANGYSDEDLAKPDRIRNLEMVLDDYCDMKSLEHFPKLQSVCLIQQDIRRIQGLDRCVELERLLLNENSIERIEGLQNCRKLQKLYLPFNCIQEIGTSLAGLVELKVLWLAANRLTSLQGLDAPNLTELNVASNRISSIEHAVDGMPCLQSLNLADNRLCSYREVMALSRLDSLRTLSFADPDFGENPICFLFNYQTYVLYHLPKLQVHDQMRVAPEAHAAAMNAFIKKRLFYNMRIKTLQRQASDCMRAAKVIDEDRRNVLARDLEAAARTLRRAWAFQQARAESPSMTETDPAEQQDLEAVEARLQQCQVEIADADAALEELKSEVSAEKSSQIRSLVLELHSGGNVRVEQGTDSTPWVAQIKDLVMSRFRHEDYEDYGITGLKVTGVSRIHHRSLRLQFDQILERVEPDADRAFEHLFYVPEPREDPQQIWEVVEAGLASRFASELAAAPLPGPFPEAQPARSESGDTAGMEEQHDHRFPDAGQSRASHQWASAPTSPAAGGASRRVLLTNTLGLAEVGHLQNFAATSLGKATQRAVLRAQKSVASMSFATEERPYPPPARCGVVLLCQVRLGEQVHDSPGSFDPSGQDVYEHWRSRPSEIPAARGGVLPVCVDNPLPLRTFYRSLQSDDRIKVWHVPHVELILPEFLVEFEYIHSFEEVRKDALRVWMEFGPFARLLSKYAFFARMGVEDTTKRRKNKPAGGQDVTQQLIAQEGPDNDSTPSHWPKALPELPPVPRLTNSVLLNPSLHITTSNFASLLVLNLHGRCLRRIEANALDGLGSLRTLLLSFNCIESLGAIPPCETLTSLDVAHNLIQKVNAVAGFPALIDLDLSWNQLLSTETFGILARDTPRLESLVILGNQLTREEWRTAALSKLVYLRMLDRQEVSTEEVKEATQRSRGRQVHLTEDLLKHHAFAPPKRGSVEERRSPLPGELCYDPENDRVSKLLLSNSAHGARPAISSSNWKSQVAAVDLHGLGLADLRGLAGLATCQTLCLDDNEVGTLDWLPALPELEELSIERCGLLSLQGVSRCQELQKLDAGGNQLTDALPGEDTCNACDLGRVAAETGSGSCKLCPLGEYANATGMSECYKCGSNTTQMEKWTTAEGVLSQGQETWIQIQGATTEAVCGCVAGTFFWQGLCEECIEGSVCAGSSKLLLEPGYFSTPEDPGSVYRCFGNTIRCPGGEPGTCAYGRDTESVSCSACLPGLHARDGVCVECVGGDYALMITFGILAVCAIAVLYLVLMGEGQKSRQPGSLLVAALGMGQMVTIVQQLTVIQQFKIDWGEPFSSILVALEVMAFDMDMISIGCVAPMDPVTKFTTRTLLVLVFFAVAAIVHFTYLAFKRSSGFQLSLLARTVGTLFMVFFISLCSSLLAPFRCNTHPNGKMTVQTYHGVYCNGTDEHLAMSVVGGLACLLPAGFLAICMWVILVELPKRLQAADVKFIRACSFLFMRFRPGAEVYSVVFLVRNALVVLCPLIPGTSGKVVSMNLLLYASLVMTAFSKPWRAMPCNFLDMALITGMLVILDMGSLFVGEVDGGVTMVICLIFSALMLLSIIAAVSYGIIKHFMLKYRKPFRYFLCHQKIQAGSYARLLKMECGKRGAKYYCFVDCDDLNDLTRLFSYVGQDSETFVILGSPDIMTRKWCVGEMVTARSHKVHSVLLMWPDFVKPDKIFIENYDSIVPDITELANYNIGLPEVRETLEWINTIETLDVPALLNPENISGVINGLTGTVRAKSVSHENMTPDCLIISDLDNMEAAATAYILLGLVVTKLMGGQKHNMPTVLQKEKSVPKNATSALVICSDGCFKSFQFAEWMLQVAMLEGCCVLPIIAEDGFRFPAQTFYDDLDKISQLETVDLHTYKKCIKAIFQEIAVVFSPQNYSSTAEDLDLRAKQVAWRLNSGQLKSLFQKVQSKEDDDEIIENGESNQAKITDLEDSNTLAINDLDAPAEIVLAEEF